MVAARHADQNLFERRGDLAGPDQQRGRLVGERIGDVRAGEDRLQTVVADDVIVPANAVPGPPPGAAGEDAVTR